MILNCLKIQYLVKERSKKMNKIGDSSHTQQQLAIAAGIKQLRRTNRWGLSPLDDALITSPEVEAYLLRNLDEDKEADARFEKAIINAVYLSIKRSKWKPRKCAKIIAKHAIEELRAARLTTLYHDKRIDARTYKEECENNYVQNTLVVARRIKKRYGRKVLKGAITVGLYLAGAPYAATVAAGSMIVNALIPQKHKEKIKKKVREIATQTIDTIQRGLTKLKEKGREIAQQAKNKLQRTFESASRIAEPVVKAAKHVADKVKEKADKVKEKVKSVWRRLFT